MLGKSLIAAAAFALATPVFAAPTVYTCKLDPTRENSWIAPQIIIAQEGDKILVTDPIILHFVGNPIPAKIATDNARRITFTWKLKHVRNNSGQTAPTFSYRATVQKATGAVSVWAQPARYLNTFEARGTCIVD